MKNSAFTFCMFIKERLFNIYNFKIKFIKLLDCFN